MVKINGFEIDINGFKFHCVNARYTSIDDFNTNTIKYINAMCFWYEDNYINFVLFSKDIIINCETLAKRFGGNGVKEVGYFKLKCEHQYVNITVFDLIQKLGHASI